MRQIEKGKEREQPRQKLTPRRQKTGGSGPVLVKGHFIECTLRQ